jgi:hypothetical protein
MNNLSFHSFIENLSRINTIQYNTIKKEDNLMRDKYTLNKNKNWDLKFPPRDFVGKSSSGLLRHEFG